MRSYQVASGQNALAQQFTNLRADAAGAGNLLVHQTLGIYEMFANPANGTTLTLTINGTNVVLTFVSTIGTTPGNILIGASVYATVNNVFSLLTQPQTSTATGIALSAADQTLVGYLSYSYYEFALIVSSNNTNLYAPLSSFSGSITAASSSYVAVTTQLYVEPGVVYVGGTRVIFTGSFTPAVTAPSTHPRIDVLTVDSSGTLAWTTGTEASSPVAPAYPANKVALIELYNVVGETALYDNANQQSGEGYILNDVRPMIGTAVNLAAVAQDIIPDGSATRNLGSASFPFATLYANAISGAAVVAYNYQSFTSNGTWTKPAGLTGTEMVIVQAWGAGGGGGGGTSSKSGGGGGGGGFKELKMRASDLTNTVSVTIGSAGTAGTSSGTSGTAGGSTTFGSYLTAYGGGGGAGNSSNGNGVAGGGGGGWTSAGGSVSANGTSGGAAGTPSDSFGGGGGGNAQNNGTTAVAYGGGGGAGSQNSLNAGANGGSSMYAGGGGATYGNSSGSGGTSVYGGTGGTSGSAGAAPGGGGGGAAGASAGGAGASGEVRVWIIT